MHDMMLAWCVPVLVFLLARATHPRGVAGATARVAQF